MIVADVERWRHLSPLLDELLDLAPAERAARLAALRCEDPALAGELAELIAEGARAEAASFLAGQAGFAEATVEAPKATLAGTTIGAYVLEAQIGQGGMGSVWKARRADGRYQGQVAFKLLHLSLIGRTGSLRFEREGAILARLSHPHIARMLDAGVTDSGPTWCSSWSKASASIATAIRAGSASPSGSRCSARCWPRSRMRIAILSSTATSSRATSWSPPTAA